MIAEKYEIIAPLGKSNRKFGQLFLGRKKVSQENVIIKAITKNEKNAVACDQLRNEALFTFDVPGLPIILDFFESATEIILVRNYVRGITLSEYWITLKRKEKINFLIELMNQLSDLFLELDRREIVHADVKPGNMLIESGNVLKVHLLDFGLAIERNNLPERKTLFPLGFAAPELILDHLEIVDRSTDIFALGLSIWYLFAGELPLLHGNPGIFTNLQITHPIPDHDKIPKCIYKVIQTMTAKYRFKIPPNKMKREDVQRCLSEAASERQCDLKVVASEMKKCSERLPCYQRISFR